MNSNDMDSTERGNREVRRERSPRQARRFYGPLGRVRAAIAVMVCSAAASCSSYNAFTPQQDVELGGQAYEEILANESLIQSGQAFQMVKRITDRLVIAAQQEDPDLVSMFDWHVELIDNPQTVNAFCLPGGKMAVYTGILPIAETETGLAVVMGHEIAHATKRHGTKSMTRAMGAQSLLTVLGVLLTGDSNSNQYINALGQAVAGLTQLKHGRDAELEADRAGLMYMARAGYDPREAVGFWQRMAALGGSGGPEFTSTHPSNESRIEQIESLLPDAVAVYEAAR